MELLKKLSGVMTNPTAYRLWQQPFADMKFRPIIEHNDMSKVNAVWQFVDGYGKTV